MMKRFAILLIAVALPFFALLGLLQSVSRGEAASSAEFSPTLSDEFNDPTTLSDWLLGPAPAATWITMDIDTSTTGHLVIVPSNTNDSGGTSNNGWYQVARGPYLHKLVTGDFILTSRIVAGNVADPAATPSASGSYNSAGFVARDPASTRANENWVMYNHGYQSGNVGLATEGKTTVNSSSVLTLRTTDGVNSGELTLCRSGSSFYMLRRMDGEADWTLEHTMSRPDLPETLQVGLVVSGWTNPTLYAQFDYARFYTGTVENSAECAAQASVPTNIRLVGNSAEIAPNSIWLILPFLFIGTAALLWKTSHKTKNELAFKNKN